MKTDDVPECVDCGVCCFAEIPDYVRVFGVDLERMDDEARAYVDFDGNRAHMRMSGGRCAALMIDPVRLRYTCAIYPMRPDVCRSLERGSGACRADIHAKSDRPLIAVAALLRQRSQA